MGLNIDVSSSGVKVTYTSSTLSKLETWTKKVADFASKTPSQHIADKINSELKKYQKWITPPKPKLIKNYDKLMKKVRQLNKDAEKAVKRTSSDMKSRAPTVVKNAVTAVYNIKASEVTAAGKAAKKTAKSAGEIKLAGSAIQNTQFVYSGRVLTPTHFSMTPRSRPDNGKKYTVKATIKKGAKKVLGTGTFLAPSGAGTTEIPFKRTTEKRLPIEAIRTVSIPQMITNETVSASITEGLQELLAERLKHNASQMGK